MSLLDLMELTAVQRPPSTPSKDSGFESDSPPPLLHSPASVKSLSSPRHESLADLSHPRDDPRGQGLEYTRSKASLHALAGLASITTPTRKPMEIQLPELEPERPLSYAKNSNADMSPPSLSCTNTPSKQTHIPPIKVLLVLSPNPAVTRELTTLDGVFRQFCADFSTSSNATAEATKKQKQKKDKWTHISLYTHWRTHGADPIHGIHHYALQAKLERKDEVQWRLALPVLEKLIDEEVRRGEDRRAFVVSGLKAGDLEGVRAFAERIAEPSGILLFSPEPVSHTVPVEYWNRTARISPESLARATAAQRRSSSSSSSSAEAGDQTISRKGEDDDDDFVAGVYRAVLAAIYARALHD